MDPDSPGNISSEVEALATSPDSREGFSALSRLNERARVQPLELVPFLPEIGRALDSASEQAREASLDTLALVSRVAPNAVAFLLPRLHTLLSKDSTVVVREQALQILTNYARSSRSAAERVLPILTASAGRVGEKTVRTFSAAMAELASRLPEASKEIGATVERIQEKLGDSARATLSTLLKNGQKRQEG